MSTEALQHLFQEELYKFTTAVTIVLPSAWNTYSKDEQLLLGKILTSVKIDINAVRIVVQPSVDLQSLRIYTPARVLIFGSASGEDLPLYQAVQAQGFMVIRADDLGRLDEQKKKNLWTALRQMFGI